jgi:hypothetical protein
VGPSVIAVADRCLQRWLGCVRCGRGTCHAFAFCKYAHRCLAEATWRFNRRFRLEALASWLRVAAARAKPWPEHRLRNVPGYAG